MNITEAISTLNTSHWYELGAAILEVESGGNPFSIGDNGTAFGPLQIRQGVIDDLNNPELPEITVCETADIRKTVYIQIAFDYFMEYTDGWIERLGVDNTQENVARIWNGGPRAAKPGSAQNLATDIYVIRVARALLKLREQMP